MDFKYLALLFVLILSVGLAFAADPTITGDTQFILIDASGNTDYYEGADRNYFNIPSSIQSGVVADADLDFDVTSCQYTLYDTNGDNAFTMSAADWNGDVNRCQVDFAALGGFDDYNFNFRVSDVAANDTNGIARYAWYDTNAPAITATEGTQIYNYTTVTITGVDVASNTGSGSDVNSILYSVDGGTWTTTASNPASFSVGGGAGEHVVRFYSIDNLDNNEMADDAIQTLTVTVNGTSAATCNLIPLILMVLAAAALVGVVTLLMSGNISVQAAVPVAISMIIFIIILYMNGVIAGAICV